MLVRQGKRGYEVEEGADIDLVADEECPLWGLDNVPSRGPSTEGHSVFFGGLSGGAEAS